MISCFMQTDLSYILQNVRALLSGLFGGVHKQTYNVCKKTHPKTKNTLIAQSDNNNDIFIFYVLEN